MAPLFTISLAALGWIVLGTIMIGLLVGLLSHYILDRHQR